MNGDRDISHALNGTCGIKIAHSRAHCETMTPFGMSNITVEEHLSLRNDAPECLPEGRRYFAAYHHLRPDSAEEEEPSLPL